MSAPQIPARASADQGKAGAGHFLFIASDYKPWPGGIAAYLDSLARGLMSHGDKTTVLAVVGPDEEERIEFLDTYEPWVIPFPLAQDGKPDNWLGSKCVSLLEILRCQSPQWRRVMETASLFPSSAASIVKLERFLAVEKPTTIVFGHLDVRLYALALALLEWQRPYGIIGHDYEVSRPPNGKRNDRVKRAMMLKGASWIVANSRHTKSLLETWGIPSARVRVVHPPISEEAFRESAVLSRVFREDDDLSLVTICRLVKGKGIDVVIDALKILAARGIPFRYDIAGDGPERTALEALVGECGLGDKVHFRGFITDDEKWHVLRNGDVFVMPSRVDPKIQHEGFGIAFVEAAAFGVPAVGSNGGGIPDAVLDGETGILVPEESPADLADALTLLYRNARMRKEMGSVARERARALFSPKAVAARFKEEIAKGKQ
jgi:phosphatidylinositol alpha-1,6-mannosyltransferase